jgi:hypothetical protein
MGEALDSRCPFAIVGSAVPAKTNDSAVPGQRLQSVDAIARVSA